MRIVSKTDIGKVRTSNQDSYAAGELSGGVAWAVVCDGMGGASGGNVASATAVKLISERISSAYHDGMGSNSIRFLLQSAIVTANATIYGMAQSVESLAGMGTTVVAVVICDGMVHIAHAGDSRAYMIRAGKFIQITRDHSIVQSMIERGELTEEEAKSHPRKNLITRAIGVAQTIEIEYNEVELEEEDAILICTDGLSNYVEKAEIETLIDQHSFYEYPQVLTERANENGGGDNITIVVLSA